MATSRKVALPLIWGLGPSLRASPCLELISRNKSALITISTSCSSEDSNDDGGSDSAGGMMSGTGASMYYSFEADFVFSFASSLISLALLGPAVSLKLLVRLQRAGVSATQLVGTCTVFLKSDVTRTLWLHTQSLAQERHEHESGNSPHVVWRLSQWNVSYTSKCILESVPSFKPPVDYEIIVLLGLLGNLLENIGQW